MLPIQELNIQGLSCPPNLLPFLSKLGMGQFFKSQLQSNKYNMVQF